MPEFIRLTENKIPVYALGDTRVDSVIQKIENRGSVADPLKKLLPAHERAVILASTYPVCDEVLIPIIPDILNSNRSVWIFPHHINKNRIEEIKENLAKHNISYSLFSEIEQQFEKVILFDKLGILAFAYEHGEIAYVGGAIHNRVHNVLEPAYFGLPIVTGKNIFHSPEAISLQESKGLFRLDKKEYIPGQILSLLKDKAKLDILKKNNHEFVLSQKGASQRLYDQFIKRPT